MDLAQTITQSQTPKISVIIPNYNHARYLAEAIQSILSQTYGNFEIIVVDDGSTDNSAEVAAGFGDKIRYIWQENRGLSAARNTGIRAAKGDYVAFLDADDFYAPKFLSTLAPILDSELDAGIAYCGFEFVDTNGRLLPQSQTKVVPPEAFYNVMVDGNFLAAHCVLVRKQCFDDTGFFDIDLHACEDWDMWIRIAKIYKVTGVPNPLAKYRMQAGSMSGDPTRMANNRLVVIRKHFGAEPDDPAAFSAIQRRAFGGAYLTTAIEYLQYGDAEQAYHYLRQMAAVEPERLRRLSTCYELGCGDQPKGSRGNFATLNIPRNADVLLTMLNKLFTDPQLSPRLKSQKRETYGNAYLALGLLGYGAKQFTPARWFLLKSIITNPRLVFDRRAVGTLIKSLPGIRLIVESVKKR